MEMQKRRQFIINFLYFGIIFMLAFVLLKYGLPMVSPFAAGFVIACILRKPVLFLAEKLPLSQKAAAVLTVLLFYCTIGILFFLTGVKAFSAVRAFFFQLPELYTSHVEPVLNSIYRGFEESFLHMDPSLLASLEELVLQFSQSLGQLVSSLSGIAMGWVSGAASSRRGFLSAFCC